MEHELRPLWAKTFGFTWKLGLLLILIVCPLRFVLVLNANVSGDYGSIGVIMLISAIIPFIFLNRYGLEIIGLTRPQNHRSLIMAFVTGLLASFVLYLVGDILYGSSTDNWYLYIGKSYKIPAEITRDDKLILFTIMALTGMTFSPIGEELFFRGIVHSSFEKSLGRKNASIIDGSAFALTHISHFGLVFTDNKWNFLVIPTTIWVTSMFLMSLLFLACRNYSGSIFGAIVCHSAFNLGMIYCIFYFV